VKLCIVPNQLALSILLFPITFATHGEKKEGSEEGLEALGSDTMKEERIGENATLVLITQVP
jgi:hypothetical protein